MIAPDLAELSAKITSSPIGTVQGRLRALRVAGAFTPGGGRRYGAANVQQPATP